jgi:glycosyltransferase involved in cell wall biosynthesis
MKILLLQDQVYLPSLGGGNKANRLLLEALAARGHQCRAIVRAFTTRAGPTTGPELEAEVRVRGGEFDTVSPDGYRLRYRGVEATALDVARPDSLRRHVKDTIAAFRPDWILVSDDKERLLLDSAVAVAPDRVILLLQTVFHLPFGPHAPHHSRQQRELMARARHRVVISEYLRDYLQEHGGLDSMMLRPPVYGTGPFPARVTDTAGYVTMVNPCAEKGLDVFLALAGRFPDVAFAAVPTWGADAAVMDALATAPNVTVLPPADDIDDILQQTRIMLVPSLWPETFGYIAVEAMLRGVPVLASDRGGLPEAKLGVDYVLPVRPAEWRDGAHVCPPQDLAPWAEALASLLTDPAAYRRCATDSRRAANAFLEQTRIELFEEFLQDGRTAAPVTTADAD